MVLALAAPALALEEKEQRDVLNSLKIMTYNPDGDFEGEYPLSRAMLAKIIIMISPSRGLAADTSKTSPYYDVPYTYWGAAYISLAAKEKLMYGYSDGSFRPEQQVLFEEAVTAALRGLGYQNSDIVGDYPSGQLSVAKNIELLDDINLKAGDVIYRKDMAKLMYNLLNCNTKDGKLFITTLGYTRAGKEVELSDVEKEYIKGPYTLTALSELSNLPLKNPTVYLNGKSSNLSSLQVYDIYSYSESSNTLWAYREKVTGVLQAVLPNREKPTSITVSGTTYQLSTDRVKDAVGLSGIELGSHVTVLKDRDGFAADVVLTENIYSERIGVIISFGTNGVKSDYLDIGDYANILLLDGSVISVSTSKIDNDKIGKPAVVTFSSGKISYEIAEKYTGDVEGKVYAEARKIGDNSISEECKIYETDKYGNYAEVNILRLSGATLRKTDILLVTKSGGKIDGIILNDFTGDLAKFGYIKASNEVSSPLSGAVTGYYTIDVAGATSSIVTSNVIYNLKVAPALYRYENGKIAYIKNLYRISGNIKSASPLTVTDESGNSYLLADDVLVYDLSAGEAEARISNIDTLISGIGNYKNISAYYDKAESQGGRIRVICFR